MSIEAPIAPSPSAIPPSHPSSAVRSGFSVVAATLLTRIVDAGKSILAVSRFGVTAQADIYNIIIGLPDFLVVVVGLDTIRGAATTYFTEDAARGNVDRSRALLSSLISWGIIVSVLLAAIAIICMSGLLNFMAGGFSQDKMALAVSIGYIIIPALILRGIVGVLQAALNAHGMFARLTLLTTITSGAIIIALIFSQDGSLARNVAAAYSVSYCIYVIIMAIIARKIVGWSFQFGSIPPVFWQVLKYSGALVISMLIAQCAVMVEKRTASYFPDGTIAALGYANALAGQVVFLGVLSLFPVIQRRLTHRVVHGTMSELLADYWNMLSHVMFVLSFIAAVLFSLRYPVLTILYRRQAFDAIALERTAGPLAINAIWIIGQTISLTTTTLLLALKNSKAIVVGSIAAYGMEIVIIGPLSRLFGPLGIVIASCTAVLVYGILLVAGVWRLSGLNSSAPAWRVIKVIASGVLTSVLMVFGYSFLKSVSTFSDALLALSVAIIGAGFYLGCSQLFGVNYAVSFMALVRRQST